jgi:D-alanine-D-alanine ligase
MFAPRSGQGQIMRITILTHVDSNHNKAHDPAVDQVAAALRKGHHKVSVLGIHDEVRQLISGLARRNPDLVFNLMEMFGTNLMGDVAATGLLELLRYGHTGGGAVELYLQQDKVLTKKLLAFEGIRYPDFGVFSVDADLEIGGRLRMPLFVKPLRADASIGIDAGAVVRDSQEMMKRVRTIHEHIHDAALVEEYIEGREFYVGILGNNASAMAFPPVEMDFSGLPDGKPHVVGEKAKWSHRSREYHGTKSVVADLPDEQKAQLQKVSLDACRALRVRDYGRVDLRLTSTNEIFVIEVNANCYLDETGEFALGGRAAGIDYPDLINRIVDVAVARQGRSHSRTRS